TTGCKVNMLIFALIISNLFISRQANSQDCSFSVNAGPGIDVCSGGQVNLGGTIGGDATKAGWRGGKGIFEPNRETPNAHYTPHASEAGTTVLLILVASNPDKPSCMPVRDEIKIVVNQEIKADAGVDQRICSGNTVSLHGSVTPGKAKETTWITNGTGTFDAPHKADAVYTPSSDDIKNGGCSIMLEAQPFGVCLPDSDVMILMIDASPEIYTKELINVDPGSNVNLVATGAEKAVFQWRSAGSGAFTHANEGNTVYKPSSGDIANETVKLHVMMTLPENNCPAEKEVTLRIKPAAKK
ncbi:MAG: hypothetical protein WBB36_02665, partial [Chitinophagales bacterium]